MCGVGRLVPRGPCDVTEGGLECSPLGWDCICGWGPRIPQNMNIITAKSARPSATYSKSYCATSGEVRVDQACVQGFRGKYH